MHKKMGVFSVSLFMVLASHAKADVFDCTFEKLSQCDLSQPNFCSQLGPNAKISVDTKAKTYTYAGTVPYMGDNMVTNPPALKVMLATDANQGLNSMIMIGLRDDGPFWPKKGQFLYTEMTGQWIRSAKGTCTRK